jgi:hypothetical protein
MRTEAPKHNAANRRRRLLFVSAVAVVVVATAITVISRQKGRTAQTAKPVESKADAAATRNFITRRVGNQDFQIDTQSGEVKPLSAEEALKLANGLAPMLDDSADGLVQVKHADGSVSMDLQGRFQSVTVARVTADGSIEQSCVDNPRAAAKFFRIDPRLIENAPTARRRLNKN